MVPFRNVVVTITPLTQHKLSDSTLDNIGTGTPIVGVQGFLDYETPYEAYKTFNVELSNPATLDLNLSDATFYPQDPTTVSEWQIEVTGGGNSGGSGSFNGTYWRIVGRPMMYDDGLQLDHAHFLLKQETYAISNPAVPD
jgi:hypothetical protein